MKKIFILILSLCMIFSLVACGSESPAETEVAEYATEPAETIATITETLPEAEPIHPEGYTFPEEVEEETFPPEDQEEVIDPTVYVTKSGEKYHKESCQWGDIPMLLSEAVAAGYTSCDKCF